MFRLILLILISFAILKMTTFGWQGFLPMAELLPKDKTLPTRLRAHVKELSQNIGDRSIFKYAQLTKATNYITGQFKDFGFQVNFQEYSLYGKQVKNIIAEKPGKERPLEIIIVGAHYDTCFNPGADDNASAIAGLLELSRLIASGEFQRTIRLIAFANEEPPFYKTEDMGSFVYARRAKNKNEDIKAVLILEMIGYYLDRPFSQRYPLFLGPFYPNRANFIAVVGNLNNRRLVKEVFANFREYSQFPIRSVVLFDFVPGVDFSDQWSFWQQGIPAVMITDTSFYRYPYYHTNSDTFEKLDYQKMAVVVEGLEAVLSELAR